jgi:hypothetical protein
MAEKDRTVNAGSGKEFAAVVTRKDEFDGEINLEFKGLPPGFHATSPLTIQAGQTTAYGVLSADADAVFGKKNLHTAVHALPLGPTTGIRDLAAVRDGILVLAGPVNDQPVTPAVFLWNEKTAALRKLGELAIPDQYKKHKAETLLVLGDKKGKPYRVLVMFDGPENGGPTEYLIPR